MKGNLNDKNIHGTSFFFRAIHETLTVKYYIEIMQGVKRRFENVSLVLYSV